jgi:uncharacterized protein
VFLVRSRILVAVAIIQSILFLGHWFVYETWIAFWGPSGVLGPALLRPLLAVLSVSFVAATLLAFRYFNAFVQVFYRIASVWLGALNFFFVAACSSWIAYGAVQVAGLHIGRPAIAGSLFGLAIVASIYGIINAASIRVKNISVKLPGLPASWRGRVAALITDTHLGHVRGLGFVSRLVAKLRKLGADVVFISGDFFDGTKVDPNLLTAPWKLLAPRFGKYFVTGNHEEFSDPAKYIDAIDRSGIRVLNSEKINLDGLQVVGIPYHDSTDAGHFRRVLESTEIDPTRASILLSHVPHGLTIAEDEGISLQLSGHTHGGQIFPFTWFTNRIFGAFTYGLNRHGKMSVYTSSGAGTWGPPMRVGTQPEIVLIHFE